MEHKERQVEQGRLASSTILTVSLMSMLPRLPAPSSEPSTDSKVSPKTDPALLPWTLRIP